MSIPEGRFWSHVDRAEDDGCWNWTACLSTKGYGKTGIWQHGRNTTIGAHRLSWMLAYGAIPPGLFVCHTCDNRRCVNPSHLFLGTNRENMVDAQVKGRLHGLPRSPRRRHKLTVQQASEIKRLLRDGVATQTIAADFGVTPSSVIGIRSGKYWRHA